MAQDPRALLQKVRALPLHPTSTLYIANLLHRQTKLHQALAEDSVYLEGEQRNTRMPQTYTLKPQMHSECKNRVRNPSPITHLALKLSLTNHPDKEAGLAFERAAAIQTRNLSEPDDAANTLVEAFKVYRKTDLEDAVRVIDFSINHYTSKGNFRRAATHKQNQAEVYEEMGDQKRAMEAYDLAASWYESDNAEA
jgi:hypothetical protein